MADFFLRMKGCSWVVVGGAYGDEYVLSLRTDYAFGNADPLMARVLDGEGSFAGHGTDTIWPRTGSMGIGRGSPRIRPDQHPAARTTAPPINVPELGTSPGQIHTHKGARTISERLSNDTWAVGTDRCPTL